MSTEKATNRKVSNLITTSSTSVKKTQQELMRYDPVNGYNAPYPSHAEQYRSFHGNVAWLFNPWTGGHRDPRDIGSDVIGLAIEHK